MRVLLVFETQSSDRLAELNPIAHCVFKRRIILLNDVDHLATVHRLYRFTLNWLTEAGHEHLAKILFLHEVLIQLLNTGHLIIVEPVGGLLLLQFIHHLRIQLPIIDVACVRGR